MTRFRIDPKAALTFLFLSTALALAPGCGDDKNGTGPGVLSFAVNVSGLPTIAAAKGHYEAWIAFPLPTATSGPGASAAPRPPSTPLHGELELISIGAFNVGPSGEAVGLDGAPAVWSLRPDRDPNFAAEAWISIETEGDSDTIPNGLALAGAFFGTASHATATLSCGYRSVFDLDSDLDLASLSGVYTLETPSDTVPTNEANGLYFETGGAAGLNLSPLDGEAVVYQGWIEDDVSSQLYSTGLFVRADSLDSDGAGNIGPGASAFPGQEYLGGVAADPEPSLPLNEGRFRAFVTLEAADDNAPLEPSGFVLLSGLIPAGASTGTPYALTNVTASLPTATFAIDR